MSYDWLTIGLQKKSIICGAIFTKYEERALFPVEIIIIIGF